MVVGQPVLEVAPKAFDGIEFGGIGREKEQPDIGGQAQVVGFVKGTIVEQEEVEGVGIGGGEVLEEELEALGIERGQFQEEALSGQGFDRAIQIQALKTIGRGHYRLNSAGCNAMANNGEQPTAAFVLRPQPPALIAALLGAVSLFLDLLSQSLLKLSHLFSLFLGCERRGAFGLAHNLYRTKACTVL